MPTHFPHNSERDDAPVFQRHMLIQRIAAGVGAALLTVGILSGFPTGIVHPSYDMSVTGSVVHSVLGGAGWLLSAGPAGARGYLVLGGLIYLVLSLSGLLAAHATTEAGVAAVMILSGVWLGRSSGGAGNV